MNLENNQSLHNLYTSTTRNVTASNDPMQLKHDTNEMLIRGAEVVVEGQNRGLGMEQTMDVVMKRLSQNQVPNAEHRKVAQASATNIADQSIFKEASKRSRL